MALLTEATSHRRHRLMALVRLDKATTPHLHRGIKGMLLVMEEVIQLPLALLHLNHIKLLCQTAMVQAFLTYNNNSSSKISIIGIDDDLHLRIFRIRYFESYAFTRTCTTSQSVIVSAVTNLQSRIKVR